jgi:hypothetical protein
MEIRMDAGVKKLAGGALSTPSFLLWLMAQQQTCQIQRQSRLANCRRAGDEEAMR